MNTTPTPRERLEELLAADPIDTNEEAVNEADAAIDAALGTLDGGALSTSAKSLLLGLTEASASVEPSARGKFIEAAQRGLAKRRDATSPLPRLLFLARQDSDESADEVANALGIDRTLFDEVERGQAPIREMDPTTVVEWIRRFEVPVATARESLLRVLRIQTLPHAAAAGTNTHDRPIDDPFYAEVMEQLEAGGQADA